MDYDRRRNSNREALSKLKKELSQGTYTGVVTQIQNGRLEKQGCWRKLSTDRVLAVAFFSSFNLVNNNLIEKKVWVNLGEMFIKMPKENVETMIKRGKSMETEAEMCVQHSYKSSLQNELQWFFNTAACLCVDQTTLDEEISDIRETMKQKVVELELLEGGDGSKSRAFQLKGMSK